MSAYQYLWPRVRAFPRENLRPREQELVALAAQGKDSFSIAREMNLAESTVSHWYYNRIANALGMDGWNPALVTQWAIFVGLIDLDGKRLTPP